MSTLLLRLAGPLQSWGTESRFNTRQTGKEPSKSGVIGMLAAALGMRRDEEISIFQNVRFGVRTDHPGDLIRDYHMVHYLKTADVTNRYYLSDAVFLVGLESEDKSLLKTLEEALRRPVWALYLGRRSGPPTQPLVLGIRELSLDDALRREPWLLPEWRQKQWLRSHPGQVPALPVNTDSDEGGYARTVVRDAPITFDFRDRQYGFRTVEGKHPVSPIPAGEEAVHLSTEHDALAELEES